ncbi:scoloptoxin SSD976-like [Rhagoletis pomonella]|uniref:scoloptoxin SSD976-like n=1 Tax=Rhagoletis pomonella TaxID=28610 RepID=UPI00177BE849|nr:scoloptoxin SSD976-like [Rhagoletis pomonella]
MFYKKKLLLQAFLTVIVAHQTLVNTEAVEKDAHLQEKATRAISTIATTIADAEVVKEFTTEISTFSTAKNTINNSANSIFNATLTADTSTSTNVPDNNNKSANIYCTPSLCELYNGSHVFQVPHIGCDSDGGFGPSCGAKPHLLYMSQRRRQFILDMHNLARERIASGQLEGYRPAAHMPMLKWDDELEYLATLHVKRCQFEHDQCRNTPHYQFSGQNIGFFWIGREFKSHAKRIKSFILNWFREYREANQTFIDSYAPHPEGKKIGHFTMLVADRAHRVGCAAIRYRDPMQANDMKLLMTCNYDFTNIFGEPVYQSGPAASKCIYKISEKYPALCDWKDAIYDYDSEESAEPDNGNELDSSFIN